MIYLKPLRVNASPIYANRASDVQYRVVNAARSVLVDWTNVGVAQILSNSGLYGATVAVDTSWGECEEQWRIAGTPFAAAAGFNANRALSSGYVNPDSGLYPAHVAFGSGLSGLAPSAELKVVSHDGTVVRDWSSSGVAELVVNSGLYGAELVLLSSYGVTQLLWRINRAGYGQTASFEVDAAALHAGSSVLNERQQQFFRRQFDVWALETGGAGPVDGTESDRAAYVRLYQNVKGRMQATHFNQQMTPFGRSDAPQTMTYNDLHVHCSYDVRGGYVAIETTPGVVSRQNAFIAVGVGEVRPDTFALAEYTHVWVTRFDVHGTNLADVYP